jgi:non-heme chloroperoxidase
VKALIYLDAGYPYAFYNKAEPEPMLERAELRRLLSQAAREDQLGLDLEKKLLASMTVNEQILRSSVDWEQKTAKTADPTSKTGATSPPAFPPTPPEMLAIMTSGVKYTNIPVPILAIFATQRDSPADEEWRDRQISAFEKGLPSAHVVRIPHAHHDVFNTNKDDVTREMTAFLASLK